MKKQNYSSPEMVVKTVSLEDILNASVDGELCLDASVLFNL